MVTHAAFARGDVLRRVKREAAGAEASGSTAFDLGTVGLGGVFDEGEVVTLGDVGQRLDVRHAAVDVHRQQGFRCEG